MKIYKMPQPNFLKSKFNAALMLTLLSTSSNVIGGIDDPSDRKVVGEIVKFSTGQGLSQIEGKDVKFVPGSNLEIPIPTTIYIDIPDPNIKSIHSKVAAEKGKAIKVILGNEKGENIPPVASFGSTTSIPKGLKVQIFGKSPALGSSSDSRIILTGDEYPALGSADLIKYFRTDSINDTPLVLTNLLGSENNKVNVEIFTDAEFLMDDGFQGQVSIGKKDGDITKPAKLTAAPLRHKTRVSLKQITYNDPKSIVEFKAQNKDSIVFFLDPEGSWPNQNNQGTINFNAPPDTVLTIENAKNSTGYPIGGFTVGVMGSKKDRFGEINIMGGGAVVFSNKQNIAAEIHNIFDNVTLVMNGGDGGGFRIGGTTNINNATIRTIYSEGGVRMFMPGNVEGENVTFDLRNALEIEQGNPIFTLKGTVTLKSNYDANMVGAKGGGDIPIIAGGDSALDVNHAREFKIEPGTKFKLILTDTTDKWNGLSATNLKEVYDFCYMILFYLPEKFVHSLKEEDFEIEMDPEHKHPYLDYDFTGFKLEPSTPSRKGLKLFKAGAIKRNINTSIGLAPPLPPKVFEPGKYVLDEKYAEQIQGKQVEWELVKDSRLEAGVDAVDSTWHLGKHTLSHAGVGKLTGKWDITADYDIAHLKEGSTAVALPHGTFKILPGSTLDASGVDTMAVEVKLTSDDFVQAGGKLLALKFPLVEVEGDGKLTIKPDTKVNVNITGTDKFIKWQATDPTVLSSTGLVVQGTQLKPEPTTFPTGQTSSLDKDYVEHVKVDGATVQLEKDVRLEDGASGTTSTWNLGSHLKSFGGWEVKRQVGYQ